MQIDTLCIRSFYGLLFLLLCTGSATAQGKLELKINALSFISVTPVELSLEYLLSDRIGMEAGVGYRWDEGSNTRLDTSMMLIKTSIESKELNYYLKGKYYFSPKHGGDRFFTGLSLDYRYYTSYTLDEEEAPKPSDSIGIGIEPGYKWAIRKKWIIETSFLWVNSFKKDTYDRRIIFFDTFLNGRLGYRF